MATHRFSLLLALLVGLVSAGAQSLSLPGQTVEGTLPNGLRYIVKCNSLPRNIVECRLVMNVGSINEADNQKGAAHFLEHLCFGGTEHFPGDGMIDYFERQGMKYGRDINAFTGFDKTIYWFTAPIDRSHEDIVDSTLLAVRDILSAVSFDAERTKRERGVIVEELRDYDTHDPFYSLKIGTNLYSRRLPLGDEADIRSIDRETLLGYYRKWYAPQFATVVVVGDIRTDEVVRKIEQSLTSLPRTNTENTRIPLDYDSGCSKQTIVDSIVSSPTLEIMIPHKTVITRDIPTTVRRMQTSMLTDALNHIFDERHIRCRATDAWYLADKNHFVLQVSGDNRDSIMSTVRQVGAIVGRLRRDGFDESQVSSLALQQAKRVHADDSIAPSSKWCDDFIDYAIAGDRHICNAADEATVKAKLLATKTADLNSLFGKIAQQADSCMLLAYKTNDADEDIDCDAIRKAFAEGATASADPELLTQSHPDASKSVKATTTYQHIGIREYRLSNGLTLLFKKTADRDREVSASLFGRGGTADLSDDDYHRLKDAVAYVDMGGLERVSTDELTSLMERRGISMTIGEADHWHDLMISAPANQAQTMLNIIYEKVLFPGINRADFEDSRRQELESFGRETLLSKMMARDIDRMISNRIDSLMGNSSSFGRRPMTRADIENMDIDEMTKRYRDLFGQTEQTYLLFTGNYDDGLEQMTINTFARMPRRKTTSTSRWAERQRRRYPMDYRFRYDNDNPTQTACNYIFSGHYEPSLRATLTMKLMRDVLQKEMLRVLRAENNIVYSPYCDVFYRGCPDGTFYFLLNVSVENSRRDQMRQLLFGIIDRLKREEISEVELEKLKRSFVVTKRQALSDIAPAEWKKSITNLLKNGETLADYDRYEEVLSTITTRTLRDAFRNYVSTEKYSVIYKGNE